MPASHGAAVAVYAHDIAVELGLTEEMAQLALLCGLVHDIGKHHVVEDLINKPSKLSEAEFGIVKQHTEIGHALLCYVAEVVRSHHERPDGTGYPDRTPNEKIPVLAKIVSVADSYNAMVAPRPYKQALTPETAIMRLREGVGTQFDKDAVDAFIQVLERKSEEYQEGKKIAPEFDAILQTFAEW